MSFANGTFGELSSKQDTAALLESLQSHEIGSKISLADDSVKIPSHLLLNSNNN